MSTNLIEIAQQVGALLEQKNLKLTTAESCTGGSLSKLITDIPGSSKWFDCGFVTYSNESKTNLIGVSAELIRQQGAVSQKVALAMAKGALSKTSGDIALSTTGIAGPDGGTPGKPVGTVCFGFATRNEIFSTDKKVFQGSREDVRNQSILYSLQCLKNYLETGHF